MSPQPSDDCSVDAAGAEQGDMSTLFGLGVLGLGAYAQGRRRGRGE